MRSSKECRPGLKLKTNHGQYECLGSIEKLEPPK